jgi:hypothetical protein
MNPVEEYTGIALDLAFVRLTMKPADLSQIIAKTRRGNVLTQHFVTREEFRKIESLRVKS